ncbi:uncharacterized protein K452DRAFT_292047 [Aplosporella prunicola CBS 121167]|uniref:N-acetyltransferase domain-containing protein n=1 Tax=Aplosporella prunicola CBS 121167 TaxID=1176127 RepID=A0A6A6B047_9PEZI|nr:uncharacterized protein K452DRAFT_292047 [Aplosporella prunicola CBS 121167]KAF2136813.1 hypothetical protein K452DRAFT_292047 [Aplosporella prunicola CBS 121167]
MIKELAIYEEALHEVRATEETLLSTLSFAPSEGTSTSASTSTTPDAPALSVGYARTLLVFATAADAAAHNPAGMALHFHNYSTWRSAPGIYIEDLIVRQAQRGKGYGSLLLGALAKEVRRIGGERLEWACLKCNEPSLKFYKGVGAERMDDWVSLRTSDEALRALAGV